MPRPSLQPDAAAIRRQREALGLGVNELGRRAGIDPGNLSRIERGLAGAHMSTLRRLAKALDVPIASITWQARDGAVNAVRPPAVEDRGPNERRQS